MLEVPKPTPGASTVPLHTRPANPGGLLQIQARYTVAPYTMQLAPTWKASGRKVWAIVGELRATWGGGAVAGSFVLPGFPGTVPS